MKLQIQDPNNELDREFGFWLISKIKEYFNSQLDPKKLINWDKFFNESEEIVKLYKTRISSERILQLGINNLTVKKIPNSLEIFMLKNQFVPGLDRVSVDTACRLITFGNQSLSGYPVLLTTLQHFADNINYYVDLYDEGVD